VDHGENLMARKEREIELTRINPNLRCIFDSESLVELRRTILEDGQLEPVRLWLTQGMFRILDGEKRWRVLRMLGVTHVRAVIEEGERPGSAP
jgi:ParB-like chromosome segregation protein Spo0J